MMDSLVWKSAYDSLVGTSHEANDTPCQDSCRVVTHEVSAGQMLFAVCADGAGSASHSQEGSQIACDHFISLSQSYFQSDESIRSIVQETVDEWMQDIREAILDRAKELDLDPRELATTLVGCVIGNETAFFIQIGDGATVFRQQSDFQYAFWPQSGEFANMTNFLTSEGFIKQIEWKIVEGQVQDVALFTDGLERLILKFEDRTVHVPAIEPMLRTINQSEPDEEFFEPLRAFLGSEGVNARTDDDKTLILATRLQHGAPSI